MGAVDTLAKPRLRASPLASARIRHALGNLLVAASFFMAWLTLRTRSFWPAALVHSAGDSIAGGLTASIKTTLPGLYLYLTELTLICVVGLIFYILLVHKTDSVKTDRSASFSTAGSNLFGLSESDGQ